MNARTGLVMGALLLVGTGCGRHYEEHQVRDVRANAGGVLRASSLTVSLPEGAVLTATVEPYDNNDDPMADADISTDAPEVLGVLRVAGDTAASFAFVGRRAGTTTVRYYAEGREVRSERATVTAR